jgi:hypothetical protein
MAAAAVASETGGEASAMGVHQAGGGIPCQDGYVGLMTSGTDGGRDSQQFSALHNPHAVAGTAGFMSRHDPTSQHMESGGWLRDLDPDPQVNLGNMPLHHKCVDDFGVKVQAVNAVLSRFSCSSEQMPVNKCRTCVDVCSLLVQAEPLMDAGMDISGNVMFDSDLLKMIQFE